MERLDYSATVGGRLRIARINAGYKTAKSFAKTNHCLLATYSAHETNRNGLKLNTAKKYARLLGVSVNWLLTGDEDLSLSPLKTKDNLRGTSQFTLEGHHSIDFIQQLHGQDSTVFIRKAGLRNNMKAIDAACYNGAMTFEIANMLGSDGKLYAFHPSADYLSAAVTKARQQELNNIVFKKENLPNIAIHDADFVYSRFLLSTMTTPHEGIEHLLRLLRPGGILAIEEPIYEASFHSPDSPVFNKAIDLLHQLAKCQNIDINIGKSLHTLVSDFPVSHVHINCAQPIIISEQGKRYIEFMTAENRFSYLEHQLVTEETIDELINALKALSSMKHGTMGCASVMQLFCTKKK